MFNGERVGMWRSLCGEIETSIKGYRCVEESQFERLLESALSVTVLSQSHARKAGTHQWQSGSEWIVR